MGERWRRWLGIGRPDVRTDVDDELQFHVEMQVRDLIASGLSPEAARREAERRFGAVSPMRDDLVAHDLRSQRRVRRAEWLADARQDLRFAARSLRRSPLFTGLAVACIALGIGVTSTIFSAVYGILLRPLPYQRAEELVALYSKRVESGIGGVNIGWPDFVSWREQNRSLSQIGLWTWTSVALSGVGDAERLEGASVTSSLFPLLGVSPVLGRHFTPADEQPANNNVILLGHGVWQQRFGGDPSAVGRTITVDGSPFVVVGIMPPGFGFPERGQVWVPFVPNSAALERGNRFLAGAIGRLGSGVSFESARAEFEQISRRLAQDYPDANRGWAADVVPGKTWSATCGGRSRCSAWRCCLCS